MHYLKTFFKFKNRFIPFPFRRVNQLFMFLQNRSSDMTIRPGTIFLLLIFPFCFSFSQSGNSLYFNHLSSERGLSQYDITSFVQDEFDFLWVGTYDGLLRLDESDSKVFRHNSNNNSIPSNRVLCLDKDLNGNIWIGTDGGGLSIYNIKKASFYNIRINNDHSILAGSYISTIKRIADGSMIVGLINGDLFTLVVSNENYQLNEIYLKSKQIKALENTVSQPTSPITVVQRKNRLLVGYRNGGLYELVKEVKSDAFKLLLIDKRDVESVFIDSEDNIWVGTNKGLLLLRYYDNYSRYVDLSSILPREIAKNISVTAICEDDKKRKWIGSRLNGIFRLSKNNDNVEIYESVNFTRQNSTIHSNRISRLFIDKSNILWIGSYDSGVAFTGMSSKELLGLDLNVSGVISDNVFISSILSDSYNNIWIGTQDQGLFRVDKNNNKIENYPKRFFSSVNQSVITSIVEDTWGNLWFATWNGCFFVDKNDISRKIFKIQKLADKDLSQYMDAAFYAVKQSSTGDIWLGSSNGLFRVKTNKQDGSIKKILRYNIDNNPDRINYSIYSICPVNDNTLIVGTKGSGAKILKFNQKNTDITIEHLNSSHKNKNKRINNNNVWSIGEADGNIYLGTDEGINILTPEKQSYKVSNIEKYNEYLENGKILSVCSEQKGFIWLGTTNGAVRIDLQNNQLELFKQSHGVKTNTVNVIDLRKTDEVIYFGGTKGVTYLLNNENRILNQNIEPKVTQLKINGNDIHSISEKENFNNIDNISYLKELKLKHDQNNISITISTFDFLNPGGSSYQYKMLGSDEKWITARNGEKTIVYQNLRPGKYKFMLRSSKVKHDTQNISPVTLTLKVSSPPWYQWWAITIYIIFFLFVTVALFKFLRWRFFLYNELKLEKFKHQQDIELNELKNKLFINVSHELRTPLTLILSPIKEITKSELDKKNKRLFSIVEYNANRLMKLTNQLLDAERNERLVVNADYKDIVGLMNLIIVNFSPLANEKNIVVSESYSKEQLFCYFDSDVLEKIVSNLVFNAIKYTKENGQIGIKCDISDVTKVLEIVIQDNGKGISKEKLKTVFDRYYQVEGTMGYGIGLSAVKQMVESHHGTIDVSSLEGEGTIFTVRIPVSKEEYISESDIELFAKSDLERLQNNKENSKKNQYTSVLIVEDNIDLRNYLVENLNKQYVVYIAENGDEGLKNAKQYLPDIIMSDVMMPIMNGIEMARRIAETDTIKHIPLIFLTAKGNIESQLEGIQLGAVDYIIKPVDLDLLKSKINNQIRIIRVNQERTRNLYLHSEKQDTNQCIDNQLIEKAEEIVVSNMSDMSFDVTKLASEMALSKMQLHRRFKSIMDVSPGEFIRLTRLKKAYSHLTAGVNNVSEIVLMTGFENHSHFSKIIKQHFGKTPHQIIAESKNKPEIIN